MMDAVTNKTANAAGVNLHTCPLHTDKEQHNQSADQRTVTHTRTLGHRVVFFFVFFTQSFTDLVSGH